MTSIQCIDRGTPKTQKDRLQWSNRN